MRLIAQGDVGPGKEVPVTIFSLGTKRKFLATPDDYTDLVRLVKRKFDIPDHCSPTFHSRAPTSDHSDDRFEIDDSAYPLMRSFMHEIEVIVEEDIVPQSKEGTRLNNVKGKAKANNTPPTSPSFRGGASTTKSKSDNEPPTRADSTLSASSSTKLNHVPVPPISNDQPHPLDLFNDNLNVEYASPTKKNTIKEQTSKAISQHVYDVDADEDESPPTPQPTSFMPKLKPKPTDHLKRSSREWEELVPQSKHLEDKEDNLGRNHGSKPSPKRTASKADEEISVNVKKEKTSKPSSTSARPKYTQTGASTDNPTSISSQNPDTSPQNHIQSQTQTQMGTSADSEPRFKIKIWGPRNQNGEFMTRKKHTVRKVLAGACKNFSIDPSHKYLNLMMKPPVKSFHTTVIATMMIP
ncbi:hypothetical protein GGU10DRAFT_343870 [Lentinula aff. detonsa]|uniref:Uncharacterized protein n=1 Tax=Lentinula aff. detonsa TaxID=2804958 RepID=A0AA38NQM2_9AGAR|nr:hypothetical protein GGU10DRAFT_343870 [Lentinula aff. detonsa]